MERCKVAIWAVVFLGLFLVGCGDPTTGDDDDDNATPTPTPTAPPEPTFSWISGNVLPRCAGPLCHGSGSDGPMTNYSQMQGTASQKPGLCTMNGFTRVTPGASADSLLFTKLTSPPPCGLRMPSGGTALSPEAVQAIGDWIDAGAPNN